MIETGALMDFGLEGKNLGVFLIFVNVVILSLVCAYAWNKLKEQRALKKQKEWKVRIVF